MKTVKDKSNRALCPKGPINPLVEEFKKIIAKVCNVTVEALSGKSRKGKIVWARHLTMYFCLRCLGHKLGGSWGVARYFGCRSHATVLWAKKRVVNQIQSDGPKSEYLLEFSECKRRIDGFLASQYEPSEPVPI